MRSTLAIISVVTIFYFPSVFAATTAPSSACSQTIEGRSSLTYWLRPGIYKGLTPAAWSAVRVGEFEMTVDAEKITVRRATGLEVIEETFLVKNYSVILPEKLAGEFLGGTDAVRSLFDNAVGFKHSDDQGPTFVFSGDRAPINPKVLIKVGLGDVLGNTFAFSPTQRHFGLYWLHMTMMEWFHRSRRPEGSRVIVPRLRYHGTAGRAR